jgi:hypothetical protein
MSYEHISHQTPWREPDFGWILEAKNEGLRLVAVAASTER